MKLKSQLRKNAFVNGNSKHAPSQAKKYNKAMCEGSDKVGSKNGRKNTIIWLL